MKQHGSWDPGVMHLWIRMSLETTGVSTAAFAAA